MGTAHRLLAILFIGTTTAVSAAQDDLDDLQRRLAELEAEQAKSRQTIDALRTEVDTSQATIEGLRSEVDTLRAESDDNWLTEQRAEEIRALVTDVLADADVRASLLQSGVPGPQHRSVFPNLAYDSQFVLQSHDGAFKLAIDGLINTRYEYNHRGDVEDRGRFEMTAVRVNFRGHVFEDWTYWVRLNFDDGTGFFDTAVGIYHFNEDVNIAFGQFPSLMTRENSTTIDKLQTGEVSPTNSVFDPQAFQGALLSLHSEKLVFRGQVSNGVAAVSNEFDDPGNADYALTGMLSWMAIGDGGDWNRFLNFTSRPGSGDPALLLGGAIHWQQGSENIDPAGRESDLFLAIAEASFEADGWNLYGSFNYRYTDPSSEGIEANDFGFVLQGGAWVAEHVELYSRFDMTIPDSDRPTMGDEFKTLTGGVAYYPFPSSDNIKFLAEVLYMFDAQSASIVQPSRFTGVAPSDEGDQLVLRFQANLRW